MGIARWQRALLFFELFLFALILVLPQVDLPEFTFRRGTAPVVARAQMSSPPMPAELAALVLHLTLPAIGKLEPQSGPMAARNTQSLLALLCTLLC